MKPTSFPVWLLGRHCPFPEQEMIASHTTLTTVLTVLLMVRRTAPAAVWSTGVANHCTSMECTMTAPGVVVSGTRAVNEMLTASPGAMFVTRTLATSKVGGGSTLSVDPLDRDRACSAMLARVWWRRRSLREAGRPKSPTRGYRTGRMESSPWSDTRVARSTTLSLEAVPYQLAAGVSRPSKCKGAGTPLRETVVFRSRYWINPDGTMRNTSTSLARATTPRTAVELSANMSTCTVYSSIVATADGETDSEMEMSTGWTTKTSTVLLIAAVASKAVSLERAAASARKVALGCTSEEFCTIPYTVIFTVSGFALSVSEFVREHKFTL